MVLTPAGLSALCLILWGLFHWLGIFAKIRTVLALLAAIGIAGFLGRALVVVATWLEHATGAVTGWALGVAVPGALFIVLAVILIHDLHPANGASRRTSYIAFAVGVLLVAGVEGIPALAPVAGFLRSILTVITGFINSL
jgi:hypothetical protein